MGKLIIDTNSEHIVNYVQYLVYKKIAKFVDNEFRYYDINGDLVSDVFTAAVVVGVGLPPPPHACNPKNKTTIK